MLLISAQTRNVRVLGSVLGGSEVMTAWCAIASSDGVLLAETCGSPSIEIAGVFRVGRIGTVAGS